jgi:hypothetical protein
VCYLPSTLLNTRPDGPNVCKLGDLKTYELMKSIDDALFTRLGKRAHKVALKVHRSYIDANR